MFTLVVKTICKGLNGCHGKDTFVNVFLTSSFIPGEGVCFLFLIILLHVLLLFLSGAGEAKVLSKLAIRNSQGQGTKQIWIEVLKHRFLGC